MTDQARLVARLGWACMAAALLSGILQGLWELAHPILITDATFAAAAGTQRWGYGLLAVIKSAGFYAGLFGLFLIATERGRILNLFLKLALLGGVFFAAVWLYMAATGHITLLYVLGGMWYQMIAPVALGIATLRRRRIAWWVGVYAIAVGILNSQIFMRLKPGLALLVQGVIWLIFGFMVYTFRSRAQQLT
jgi:hypothetical protein